jgi:hypothetical protein
VASKANRDGVAERFPAPAVPKSMAVDLALLGDDDPLRNALEAHIGTAAKQHDAQTLSRLQTVPGIGTRLRLVLPLLPTSPRESRFSMAYRHP